MVIVTPLLNGIRLMPQESGRCCVSAIMRGLFLSVIMATLVSVAPAHGQEPVTLAGTTVVDAQRSGMARVRIPQDARVGILSGDNPDLAFDGGGRFAGVYLRRLAAPLSDAQFAVAWQDEPCTPSRCDERLIWTGLATTSDGRDLTLPAGDYELAFVVDHGPARATLRLEGLDGTTTISPAQTVAATIAVHEAAGSLLVDDFASSAIHIGKPYGIEIFEYDLSSTAPGAVAFQSCDASPCAPVPAAKSYTEGGVDDGPYGAWFRAPQSYTRTVNAAGALAAPWNAKLTTVAVTLSAGTVPG
jgi:hypothetical protein